MAKTKKTTKAAAEKPAEKMEERMRKECACRVDNDGEGVCRNDSSELFDEECPYAEGFCGSCEDRVDFDPEEGEGKSEGVEEKQEEARSAGAAQREGEYYGAKLGDVPNQCADRHRKVGGGWVCWSETAGMVGGGGTCPFTDAEHTGCLSFRGTAEEAPPRGEEAAPGEVCGYRTGGKRTGICGNTVSFDRGDGSKKRACPWHADQTDQCRFRTLPKDVPAGGGEEAPVVSVALPPAPLPGDLVLIAPKVLSPSPFQVRTIRGTPELDAALEELAESIQAHGVVQPLAVREIAGRGYEIVAGHRRHAAALLAKVDLVPCYVIDANDIQAESMLVVENLQRKDLSPIEEAESVSRMAAHGLSHAQIAAATAKSVRWVYRRMSLAKIVPEWRAFGVAKGLSAAFLEEVARLPDAMQRKVYGEMLCQKILDGEADEYVDQWHQNGGDLLSLRETVDNETHVLERAPWMEHCPMACEKCITRSDRQPDLFEVTEEARCLDDDCWKKTLEKWAGKEGLSALKSRYGSAESIPAQVYYRTDTRHQQMQGYSKPGLIADGPSMGRVIWLSDNPPGAAGSANPERQIQRGPTPAQKAEAKYIRETEAWIAQRHDVPDEADVETLLALATMFGVSPFDYDGVPSDYRRSQNGDRLDAILVKFRAEGMTAMCAALWAMVRTPLRRLLYIDTVSNCGMAFESAKLICSALGLPPPAAESSARGKRKGASA